MAINTTRHALTQARKLAENKDLEVGIRERLAEQMIQVAQANVKNPPSVSSGYGKLVYRLIAIALGLVALLVVIFTFVLLLSRRHIDAAFYSVGSAAVGALGGVFSPGGASGTPPIADTSGGAGGIGQVPGP